MFLWLKNNFFKRHTKLHGFNLEKWNYLGHTTISLHDKEHDITLEATLFFFVSRKDEFVRDYVLLGENKNMFKNHSFLKKYADAWKANELPLCGLSLDMPSAFTRVYMKEKYKQEWDYKNKKWVDICPKDKSEAKK